MLILISVFEKIDLPRLSCRPKHVHFPLHHEDILLSVLGDEDGAIRRRAITLMKSIRKKHSKNDCERVSGSKAKFLSYNILTMGYHTFKATKPMSHHW